MQFNHFDNAILGAINNGQAIAVDGTHRTTLRVLVAKLARRLRLAAWGAPVMAMCPSCSGSSPQRRQRWMPGVVVDPGTVGVR